MNKLQIFQEVYGKDYVFTETELGQLLQITELIVQECVGILETEIELQKEYKSIACNDFDARWCQGKIDHFTKLVKKTKQHFGVES